MLKLINLILSKVINAKNAKIYKKRSTKKKSPKAPQIKPQYKVNKDLLECPCKSGGRFS